MLISAHFFPLQTDPYLPFPTRDASWVNELSDSVLETMVFLLIMTCELTFLSQDPVHEGQLLYFLAPFLLDQVPPG